MEHTFFSFLHSLLRYGVVLSLLFAVFVNLRGWLMARPILTGERMVTILAMVLCHVQLVIGVILYAQNFAVFDKMSGAYKRFWKFEHIGTMILAVLLITLGRMLSKRAKEEQAKQRLIAIFYGIGLLLILWAIPWPITDKWRSLGWL